jgi:hypothetical protein
MENLEGFKAVSNYFGAFLEVAIAIKKKSAERGRAG